MKVLLDEGVPEELAEYLLDHEVSTVKDQQWNGIKNGKLLNLIEGAAFQALITNDKRMEFEQKVNRRR